MAVRHLTGIALYIDRYSFLPPVLRSNSIAPGHASCDKLRKKSIESTVMNSEV